MTALLGLCPQKRRGRWLRGRTAQLVSESPASPAPRTASVAGIPAEKGLDLESPNLLLWQKKKKERKKLKTRVPGAPQVSRLTPHRQVERCLALKCHV